jgi:hypothetical protein
MRLASVLVVAALSACRGVGPAFGPSLPEARVNAEDLFGGIAQRFTNVQRNPKFAIARGKLGRNALTPSAIYDDTAVWTAMRSDGTRTVAIDGEFSNNRYLLSARSATQLPDNAGDSRQIKAVLGGWTNQTENPICAGFLSVAFDERAAVEKESRHLFALLQNGFGERLAGNFKRLKSFLFFVF